jgi:hypothetical protein
MKIFLNLKTGVVLALSCFLFLAVVVSCTRKSNPSPEDEAETIEKETKGILTCELPRCGGSDDCCYEEDEQCDNWCDSDLNLGGRHYDACVALRKDTVKDLVELFDEKLKKPKEDDLDDLGKEEQELICGAVKELDYDILGDLIDNYNHTRAKQFLEWAGETPGVADIFKNAEDDEGEKMFKRLLYRASGGTGETTDQGILDGLTEGVNKEEAGEHVLYLAFKNKNENLIEFIHEEIVSHRDELCDDKHYPEPDAAALWPDDDGADQPYASTGFEKEACVLGVYCKIAAAGDDASDFRHDMAKFLGDGGDMADFIEESLSDGGLGLTEDDAEDWTDAACTNLKTYWNDKEGGLDLDLTAQ